jgi:hypothetical protein
MAVVGGGLKLRVSEKALPQSASVKSANGVLKMGRKKTKTW